VIFQPVSSGMTIDRIHFDQPHIPLHIPGEADIQEPLESSWDKPAFLQNLTRQAFSQEINLLSYMILMASTWNQMFPISRL
jgi:hypothetical protein